MHTHHIENKSSGKSPGNRHGENATTALQRMARGAGYSTREALAWALSERKDALADDLIVTRAN